MSGNGGKEKPIVEEDRQQGIELLAKAESFWFEQPEEKRHQMLIETVNAGYIASFGSPSQSAQVMFRIGYYYGKKEETDG